MTLRIGMIAPISHPYPPPGYGPWEQVCHDLTERLVEAGHDVTLFAPADSVTKAKLTVTVAAPLSADPSRPPRLEESIHIAAAFEAAHEGRFDLMHSHLHVHALVFSRLVACPVVTTLHGAAWDRANHPLLLRYADRPFVSLSDRERSFLPDLNYVATVPNGIHVEDIGVGTGAGGYLAFVGRMAPEKAPDLAVAAATKAGLPLLMAGPVEERHFGFFEELMDRLPSNVRYQGDLPRADAIRLMGDAAAVLMPLRWHEPFGLVAVEALAAGTPVVAWDMGAMPEIVEDGVTGFVVADVAGAVDAISRVGDISRGACRTSAERRFSDATMAASYSAVYEQVVRTSRR